MNETQQQTIGTQTQNGLNTAIVPYHTHSGSDGPNVPATNVSGHFPMVTAVPSYPPTGSLASGIAMNTSYGQIFYYDYTNAKWRNTTTTPRVVSITTSTSYTVDTDSYDCLSITALASTINTLNASGTPYNFQKLIIRIKDNGTSQTIDWGTAFAEYGTALPSSTTAGKVMTIGFIYDSVAAIWGCVALQIQ